MQLKNNIFPEAYSTSTEGCKDILCSNTWVSVTALGCTPTLDNSYKHMYLVNRFINTE